MIKIRIIFIFVTLLSVPAFMGAQQIDASSNTQQEESSAARYILPGTRTTVRMEINLWGEVSRPGIYVVPEDIDIVALISSAGGPTQNAKLEYVKIIRGYPQEGEPRVINVDVRNYLKTADVSELPELNPGDTVFVPSGIRQSILPSFTFVSSIVSMVASLALILYRTSGRF